MKTINQLMQSIIQLTGQIETNYPELYKYLEETPLNLGETKGECVTTRDLENYLDILKRQLRDYMETHRVKNNLT